MSARDGHAPFFPAVWAGAAPLLLWALHFAFCYAAVAVGCTAAEQDGGLQVTPAQVRWVLGLATGAALGAGAWLLAAACRALRRRDDDLLATVRWLAAVMALAGMVWTGWPMAVLPVCQHDLPAAPQATA